MIISCSMTTGSAKRSIGRKFVFEFTICVAASTTVLSAIKYPDESLQSKNSFLGTDSMGRY